MFTDQFSFSFLQLVTISSIRSFRFKKSKFDGHNLGNYGFLITMKINTSLKVGIDPTSRNMQELSSNAFRNEEILKFAAFLRENSTAEARESLVTTLLMAYFGKRRASYDKYIHTL